MGEYDVCAGWLIALLFVLAVPLFARLWTRRSIRCQQAAEAADRLKYSQWKCPDCGGPFGKDVFYVKNCRDYEMTYGGRHFLRHVIIVCRRCRLVNEFDPQGNAFYQAKELVEARVYPHGLDEENLPALPADSKG